ncbi:signal peptidase II [Actinomycetaceae bacterium TAE3-ERU4]|nr:signal peptidase II [Actinomycetaceae bacterium TAE3-ERU4]
MFFWRPFWGLILLSFLLDQITKILALSYLGSRQIDLLGTDFFFLRLIRNPGAAFSLGSGRAWIFSIVSVCVCAFVIYYARRVTSRLWGISLAFIVGGALGNLIDRLFRAPGWGSGHVVDFIGYGNLFIGNVADIWICVAAASLVIFTFTGPEPYELLEDKKEENASAR